MQALRDRAAKGVSSTIRVWPPRRIPRPGSRALGVGCRPARQSWRRAARADRPASVPPSLAMPSASAGLVGPSVRMRRRLYKAQGLQDPCGQSKKLWLPPGNQVSTAIAPAPDSGFNRCHRPVPPRSDLQAGSSRPRRPDPVVETRFPSLRQVRSAREPKLSPTNGRATRVLRARFEVLQWHRGAGSYGSGPGSLRFEEKGCEVPRAEVRVSGVRARPPELKARAGSKGPQSRRLRCRKSSHRQWAFGAK